MGTWGRVGVAVGVETANTDPDNIKYAITKSRLRDPKDLASYAVLVDSKYKYCNNIKEISLFWSIHYHTNSTIH